MKALPSLSVAIFSLLLMLPISAYSNHTIEFDPVPISLKDGEFQKIVFEVEAQLTGGKILPAAGFDPYTNSSYVKCVDVSDDEIKGSMLCLFDNQKMMNVALTRASLFVEMNAGLLSSNEMFGYEDVEEDKRTEAEVNMSRYMNGIKGHDLQGKDLRRFWEAYYSWQLPEFMGPVSRKYEEYEWEFMSRVLFPRFEFSPRNDKFVIIAVFLGEKMCAALSHEVLHAQFFLDEEYQKAVRDYISNNVDNNDMKTYIDSLSSIYTTFESNPFYRDNEFMAWTLQYESHKWTSRHEIPDFRNATPVLDKYREPMKNYLTGKGQAPLIVETDCSKWGSIQ